MLGSKRVQRQPAPRRHRLRSKEIFMNNAVAAKNGKQNKFWLVCRNAENGSSPSRFRAVEATLVSNKS